MWHDRVVVVSDFIYVECESGLIVNCLGLSLLVLVDFSIRATHYNTVDSFVFLILLTRNTCSFTYQACKCLFFHVALQINQFWIQF